MFTSDAQAQVADRKQGTLTRSSIPSGLWPMILKPFQDPWSKYRTVPIAIVGAVLLYLSLGFTLEELNVWLAQVKLPYITTEQFTAVTNLAESGVQVCLTSTENFIHITGETVVKHLIAAGVDNVEGIYMWYLEHQGVITPLYIGISITLHDRFKTTVHERSIRRLSWFIDVMRTRAHSIGKVMLAVLPVDVSGLSRGIGYCVLSSLENAGVLSHCPVLNMMLYQKPLCTVYVYHPITGAYKGAHLGLGPIFPILDRDEFQAVAEVTRTGLVRTHKGIYTTTDYGDQYPLLNPLTPTPLTVVRTQLWGMTRSTVYRYIAP